jgi:hypothetical protein
MHPYTTDTGQRSQLTISLVLGSSLVAILINAIVLNSEIDLSNYGWVLSPPTVFTIYGFFWTIFDKWVWRLFSQIGMLDVPNLNGEWSGTLKTSYNKFENDILIKVFIKQSWSNISITLRTEKSSSRSITATIVTKNGCFLTYDYVNEPKGHAQSTMTMHRGTASLELISKNELRGQYYTSRDRQNHGEIFLDRISSKIS